MNVTIKDIAERAGLSYSTVSRALNGKYGVDPETRRTIIDLAKKMRYRPNAMARGLITRKTDTIGLIIPDLRNPFFPEVAAGIEAAAEESGYSVFLCASDWSALREDRYLSLLQERRVDGIIIAPVMRPGGAESPEMTHGASVYVSSVPHGSRHPYVTIDNRRGGYLAASHLIERGHVPIGVIGADGGSDTGEERRAGYRDALEHHGIAYDPALVRLGPFSRSAAAESALDMMRSGTPPGGLFVENDDLALAVLEALTEPGYRVPEDVAVIGFDDISIARMHSVELSTVAQPIHEMGRRAVELLMARIEGTGETESVVLEPHLIARATT